MSTSTRAVRKVTAHVANAKAIREALLAIGPRLLRVDDMTLELPIRQISVCHALSFSSGSMSQISRLTNISLSGMTQVVDRLERLGIVERFASKDDRRLRMLQLTAKGRQLMNEHEVSQVDRIAACLEQMSAPEVQRLESALRGLVEVADKVAAENENQLS
jgi:DNA-binding MarR family transcriptional regulator